MKKLLISICIIFIAIAFFSSKAFSWGAATHAYIAGKELGYPYGYLNLQEMYGAMAPDIPWIMFDAPEEIRNAFGYQTHYEFQKVANVAWWRSQRAFAYGFLTAKAFKHCAMHAEAFEVPECSNNITMAVSFRHGQPHYSYIQ